MISNHLKIYDDEPDIFRLIFGLLFCDHSLPGFRFITRRSCTQYEHPNLERTSSSFAFATGAYRVELHQSPTKSVILQNCEAHLIFSLCFGCLWLVLCQIRPEGPSKAIHVAMLLFLFDPFSMGLSSTFSGWKARIPRPAYRVTCGKPWIFDWVSCTLDPVKSPMSLSKSPCL